MRGGAAEQGNVLEGAEQRIAWVLHANSVCKQRTVSDNELACPPVRSASPSLACPPSIASYEPWSFAYAFSSSGIQISVPVALFANFGPAKLHGTFSSISIGTHAPSICNRTT
jgi:hypothetical protein